MGINDKVKVGRGAIYLYAENVLAMISGYFFWLFASRLTTPDVIGITGSIVSFSIIVSTFVNLGVPVSIQKFLGRTFAKEDFEESAKFFVAAIILLFIAEGVCVIAIVLSISAIGDLIKIEFNAYLMIVTILLIVALSVGRLFRGIIIASIRTKSITIATGISTLTKFTVAFVLLALGGGVLGLVLAIVSFTIVETAILAFASIRLFNVPLKSVRISLPNLIPIFRSILLGGFPYWVPTLITALGTQLGTVLVFGWQGASEAGFYFIAYSIYAAIATVITVIFAITFPVLSSMDTGHGILTWKTIKFSLVFSIPFTFSVVFYPSELLSLFGQEYSVAAIPLIILMISVIPVAIIGGINNFYYSRGEYRKVMLIGILTSVPRTVIYFILVPPFGGEGAATAFTIGSVIGMITSIIYTRNADVHLSLKDILLISACPLLIAFVFSMIGLNYILAIICTVVFSYAAYLRIGTVNETELRDISVAFPAPIRNTLFKALKVIVRKDNPL